MRVRFTILLLGAALAALASCTRYPARQTTTERFAPADTDTSAVSIDFHDALLLKHGGLYDSALVQLTSVCATYQEQENWSDYVRCSAQMGMCSLELARFDSAAAHLDEALHLGRRHLGDRHPLVGGLYSQVGRLHTKKSEYEQAFGAFRKSLDILLASLHEQDLFVAETYHNLATAYRITGDYERSSDYFGKALQTRIDLLGENHPDVARTYNGLGALYAHQGNYDLALTTLEKALRINESTLSPGHPHVVPVLGNIGYAYRQKGEFGDASITLNRALEIALDAYGERHPRVASLFNDLGIVNLDASRYDEAIDHLNKSLVISLSKFEREHREVAITLTNLGRVHSLKGEYETALDLLHDGQDILVSIFGDSHPDLATNLQWMGTTYRLRGDYDRAFALLRDARYMSERELGENHELVASVLNDLGIVHVVTGSFDKAIYLYTKAIDITSKLHSNNHRATAIMHNNLGNAYRAVGDYDRALDMLHSARRINVTILGADNPRIATNLNNLGRVFLDLGEYEVARRYFQEALDLFLQAYGEVHPYVANQYNALGSVTSKLGAPQESLAHYEKALRIFRTTSGETDPYVARGYNALGNTYAVLGDRDRALFFLLRALEHRIAGYGKSHPQVAETYNDIGELHRSNGSLDRALQSFENALCANSAQGCDELTDLSAGGLSEEDWLLSLWGKARVLTSQSSKASDIALLETAVKVYLEAVQSIDRMRRNVRTDGSKLHLSELGAPLLADAVAAAVHLYQQTGNAQHKRTAFYFAEKGKATLLLEAFSETRARKIAGIPDSLLDQERWILTQLEGQEQRLRDLPLAGDIYMMQQRRRIEDQVFELKGRREELIVHLEAAYPDYYQLKYNVEVASPSEIRSVGIGKESALLEYVLGEDNIFIFIVISGSIDVAVVPRDSLFEGHIAKLRKGIIEQDYNLYTTHAYALYQYLLEPIIGKLRVKDLVIVPDGMLSYIPFEALLSSDIHTESEIKDYRSLPYVIRNYAISYSYSATLLVETRQRRRPPPPRDFLGFAPIFARGFTTGSRGSEVVMMNDKEGPTDPSDVARAYLPRTRAEVTGIQRLFLSRYSLLERFASRKAMVYLEEDATEARLKGSPLDEYRFVHFATHGFANHTSPEASGIVLFPEANLDSKPIPEEEDGVLRLSEVYNLRFNADLVVLSACETGIGPIARGEGILSLTRGFLFAGASNVLVSLWKADDLKTAEIMPKFYSNVLEEYSKASALRQAKLDLIQDHPRYARPFYWAPFVLVGK